MTSMPGGVPARPRIAQPSARAVAALVAACAGAYLVVAFGYGPMLTVDGTRDIQYARALAAVDFNPLRYAAAANEITGQAHPVPKVSYFLYIALIASLERMFGGGWVQAIVAVNVVAQTAVAAIVLSLVRANAGGWLPLVSAAAFSIFAFDYLQWAAMTQSDTLFLLPATGAVVLATIAATRAHGTRRSWWIAAVAALVVAALCRPTWPPVAAAMASAAYIAGNSPHGALRRFGTVLLAGAAATVVGMLAVAWLFYRVDLAPDWTLALIHRWRPFLAGGQVVLARPDTFLGPQDSVLGFASVMAMRIPSYFRFWAEGLSRPHTILNAVTHVPLYALALAGLTRLTLRPNSLTSFALVLGLTAVVLVLALDAFHCITILDFDWRYRAPAYPPMILLAALALSSPWPRRAKA